MNQRISVSTIENPEFINLETVDVNPLMSKGVVKVFYIGQNRNGSFITKEVATNMSKTLRGCPIVGQYKEEKQDFVDHGDQVIIDGDGIKFNTLTKPYGFVSPDAKVWFQFFEDTDEFGNSCLREYLCTEAYLWTEQFPETKRVFKEHNPQSMELDEKSIEGHWATDNNSGLEFFIINDAIFSKLCILGEDVEPCFEGSMFLPETSSNFSKQDDFMKSLFTMMEELKFALKSEGGLSMPENENQTVEQVNTTEVQENEAADVTSAENSENNIENFSSEQDENNESNTVENDNIVEGFAKKDDEKKSEEDPASQEDEDIEDDEKKKPASKNNLNTADFEKLQNDFSQLQNDYALLQEENKKLLEFKQKIEDEKKDELIASFYMLSDEDKADVIKNKTQYSLDDIEAKLSVICCRKKVSFDLEEKDSKEDITDVATTFNLNNHEVDDTPAWLKVVEDIQNRE